MKYKKRTNFYFVWKIFYPFSHFYNFLQTPLHYWTAHLQLIKKVINGNINIVCPTLAEVAATKAPSQDLDPVLDLDLDINEVKYSLPNLFWNRIQGAYIYLFNRSREHMKMILLSLQNSLVVSPLSHTPMDGLRQNLVTSSNLNIWSRYTAFLFSL